MTPDDHRELRTMLGALLLDGLGDADRRRVETHLQDCEPCRAELAELRPVAEAMAELRTAPPPPGRTAPGPAAPPARTPIRTGVTPAEPPPSLGDRVGAAVAAERRAAPRRRWARQGALTVVAASVAGLVVVAGLRVTAPEPGPVVPLEAVPISAAAAPIRASAALVPHTWGVEVKLRATGFDAGARYVVVVLDDDGRPHDAGEFVGTGAREMNCNLNSAVLRPDATGFEVRDAAGQVVVTSRFA